MSSEIARGHVHVQETASTSWTIVHGLDTLEVNVNLFVDVNGVLTKMFPKKVQTTDVNTVVVTFTAAQKGEAYVI